MINSEVTEDVDALHPMYAVSGYLIMRAGRMERWLFICASTLKVVPTYLAAEGLGVAKISARLSEAARQLPDTDQANLLAALATASEVLQLRHALVHGLLLYDDDKQLFESQRPPRASRQRGQVDQENQAWVKHQFTVSDVMDAGRAAGEASNLIQSCMLSWQEAVGLREGT